MTAGDRVEIGVGVTPWGGPLSGAKLVGEARDTVSAEVCRRYRAGASIRMIAAGIGRSYGSVRGLLTEAGVELRPRGSGTASHAASGGRRRATTTDGRPTRCPEHARAELRAALAGRYRAGETIRDLAVATDRSYGLIHTLLREADVPLRRRGGRRRPVRP